VIRNVVMVKLKDGYDEAWLDDLLRRFQALNCPGTAAYTVGTDLRLREGGWTFAIVADFVDVDAYRAYDADELHNQLRGELAPHVEQIGRVQFQP
jgi:predicted signal transduction protein with EAL and GGDEF domain